MKRFPHFSPPPPFPTGASRPPRRPAQEARQLLRAAPRRHQAVQQEDRDLSRLQIPLPGPISDYLSHSHPRWTSPFHLLQSARMQKASIDGVIASATPDLPPAPELPHGAHGPPEGALQDRAEQCQFVVRASIRGGDRPHRHRRRALIGFRAAWCRQPSRVACAIEPERSPCPAGVHACPESVPLPSQGRHQQEQDPLRRPRLDHFRMEGRGLCRCLAGALCAVVWLLPSRRAGRWRFASGRALVASHRA